MTRTVGNVGNGHIVYLLRLYSTSAEVCRTPGPTGPTDCLKIYTYVCALIIMYICIYIVVLYVSMHDSVCAVTQA